MIIGILIREFQTLENWELRIIDYIKKDLNFELALLVMDGQIPKNVSKYSPINFLWNMQVTFEKSRYLKHKKTVNKDQIITYLKTIPKLILKDNTSVFSKVDVEKIKKYNLDILLKLDFTNPSGDIINAAKNGIWYLSHNDFKKGISMPSGFLEVLQKDSIVNVSLLQLTENRNRKNLIDTANFNRHKFSYVETNFNVIESSVSLLIKNFQKLDKGNELEFKERDISFIENFKTPSITQLFQYQSNYFLNFGKGFIKRLLSKFGGHEASWTLFIGKGNFLDADLTKIISVNKPKNEFWADPFLFAFQKEYYIFFEKFPYSTARGILACGKVKGNDLIEVMDVLDLEYHLSYPFIFEEEGEIYLMPETNANNRLEIYKCVQFPNKWELFRTAFEGERIADSFFYTDNLKQKWLFLNKACTANTSLDNELYIYKVDSINLNKIEPHRQNPIHIDSQIARNGGAIFDYHNKKYRPSQRNTDGIYGKALNINQIEKLTLDEYYEKAVRIIEPNFQEGLKSIHHLHQIDNMFVFDASF
jgi:hypothetical protein